MVWINGLLFKLHEFRVRGKLLRLVHDSFRYCSSRVLLSDHLSEPYAIEQGTRQGSICAPFYYITYLDALLNDLQSSTYALRVGNLLLSAPTQADDIVLLSMSRRGLNDLLNICYTYACKWRYLYNPKKCAASVLRRKKSVGSVPKPAMYGSIVIPETDTYKHLGIVQLSHGKHPHDTDTVTRQIRGTFLSVTGTVSGRYGPNPSTALKLYYACVLPRALFGCELWSSIS